MAKAINGCAHAHSEESSERAHVTCHKQALHVTSSRSREHNKNMADVEATKSLTGLLNGIAQKAYYNNDEITEELLKTELYPDLSLEDFNALHEKMKGLLKVGGFVINLRIENNYFCTSCTSGSVANMLQVAICLNTYYERYTATGFCICERPTMIY